MISGSQNHLDFPGHDLGIGDGGDLDLPPESDESFPVPGPEIDTGAIAVVPGATAGVTAGLPGTGVQNTSNYSDFLSSCSQEQAFSLCVPKSAGVCHAGLFPTTSGRDKVGVMRRQALGD